MGIKRISLAVEILTRNIHRDGHIHTRYNAPPIEENDLAPSQAYLGTTIHGIGVSKKLDVSKDSYKADGMKQCVECARCSDGYCVRYRAYIDMMKWWRCPEYIHYTNISPETCSRLNLE